MRIVLLWSSSTVSEVTIAASSYTCKNKEYEDESSVKFDDMHGLLCQTECQSREEGEKEQFEH